MSLFRDTALSAMGALIATGARFLVTIMIVRRLEPSAYGDFVFAQWVVDLLFLSCSVGLPGAMTRFLPALTTSPGWRRDRLVKFIFAALAGSMLLVLSLFTAYLMAGSRTTSEVVCLLFFAGGYLLASCLSPVLQGLYRFEAVVAGNVAFAVSAPLLVLALMRTPTISSAALALGAAWLLSGAASVAAATAVRRSLKREPLPDQAKPELASVAAYAGNIWIIALISSLVWSRGELGILRLNVDSGQIAIYAAALSLIGLVSQGAGLLTGALTPHLVSRWQTGDTAGLNILLRAITQATLIASVACALALAGLGEHLIPALLGNNYVDSFDVILILCISTISICSGCANTLLQIETNGKYGLFINIIALSVLVIASLCLTPLAGVAGAAYARVTAQSVVGLLVFHRLAKVAHMSAVARDLTRAFIFSLLGLAAYCAFHTVAQPGRGASGAVAVFLGVVLLVAVRWIIGVPFLSFLRAVR